MTFATSIGSNGWGPMVSTFVQNKYPKYQKTYYATSSADINTSASVYWTKGWNVTITEGTPYKMDVELNVELSGDGITPVSATGSYVTKNWAYKYNVNDKEIWHCSSDVIPWINQITDADKHQIDYIVANPPATSSVVNFTSSFSGGTTSISASQVVLNMFNAGFTKVPIKQPVLHLRLQVPAAFNMSSLYSYDGYVITKGTLSGLVGIPSNYLAIMPQGTDPSPTSSYNIPMHYGWWQQPTTNDMNGSVITIDMEWHYGLYPQNIYGVSL